jgi:chemotaxis protein methyltransferase CheR
MDAPMSAAVSSPSSADIELRLLLEAIYLRFHHDFRRYSRASIRRRVVAALPRLGCATISALQEKVLHEPAAFEKLLCLLTVQVSDMFRDPAYFRVFRERIVPELRTYPSVKIWVPGCSAGEEVHSLAIVLHEEKLLERATIYGTDINPNALEKAAAGVYPVDRIATFSANHLAAGGKRSLSEYYTSKYGSAIFDRSLRKHLVFSEHSLATDDVFAEVQIVSCRNVLIYFDRELQDRALGLFEKALCRRGFLGLGTKESIGFTRRPQTFHAFAADERWYQR